MRAVKIKNLRDNLSRYLRMVREGETVWVLDRDQVIAEIHRPTTAVPGSVSRWEAFLNEQERIGGVIRAKNTPGPSLRELYKLARPEVPIDLQQLLDEVEAD